MNPLLRKILGINWVLLLTMYGLLIFGIYSIESAARHLASGGEAIAQRQELWIIIGSVVYFVTALLDYRWIRYLGIPMYLGGVGLMVVALLFGNEVHQLVFAGVTFQPAQFAIVAGIVLMASMLQDLPKWHPVLGIPMVKVGVIGLLTMIPFGLVAVMGDMGSALVWVPVVATIMLVGGVPFRYLSLMVFLGVAAIPPMYYMVLPEVSERGTGRIELYLDMLNDREVDITGDAYAPYYVSMAIGKAGYKGTGWNADSGEGSIHAKRYIPWKTAHNDFIFGVIGEEQGFRGSLLLVTSFGLLLIQGLFIAFYSRDLSGQIIVASVVALFFAHIFESIGMCIKIMPITGIPLPLISYSGTFVVMCMFMLGLIQSVWIHRNVVLKEDEGKPVKLSKRGRVQEANRLRGEGRDNLNTKTERGGV